MLGQITEIHLEKLMKDGKWYYHEFMINASAGVHKWPQLSGHPAFALSPLFIPNLSTLLKPLICLLCLPAPLGPHHHYQNQHRSFYMYLLSTYKPGTGILWTKHAETYFLYRLWSTNKESLVCQVVVSQWKLKQVMGGRKWLLLLCFLDRRVRESTWHWVQMWEREGGIHARTQGREVSCGRNSKY